MVRTARHRRIHLVSSTIPNGWWLAAAARTLVPKAVVAELERLTTIVRYVHAPALAAGQVHPVLDIMQKLWPVLEV